MKAENTQHSVFIELYILPLDEVESAMLTPFNATGGYAKQARLEKQACSVTCPHRHDNLVDLPVITGKKPKNACYVDLVRQIKHAVNNAAKALKNNEVINLNVNDFELRISAWGDIDRLNDEGLQYIKLLQDLSGDHLSYSAGALYDPRIKELGIQVQASCTTISEAIALDEKGFKVYFSGSEEDKRYLQKSKVLSSPMYRCPIKDGNKTSLGCTSCPIRCDGSHHVLSP